MVTDHNKIEDVTKALTELNHFDMILSSHVAFHAHPHLTLRVYNTFSMVSHKFLLKQITIIRTLKMLKTFVNTILKLKRITEHFAVP